MDAAETALRKAVRLRPLSLEAHAALIDHLTRRNRPDAVVAAYRELTRRLPDLAVAHYNLGVILNDLRRPAEAEAAYREALRVRPDYGEALANLGVLLMGLGRFEEAEAALWQLPELPEANLNLAQLLLRSGRFAEGWRRFEFRYHPRLTGRAVIPPDLPFPAWRGEDLAGKSLLVIWEQGFGDAIQFCRYLPILSGRGAARITFLCDRQLISLLATGLRGVGNLALDWDLSAIPRHDYWVFLLSIPCLMGTEEASIPASLPYLSASPERMAFWRDAMPPGAGLRVGLAWKGRPDHVNDANRSLPGLAVLASLWGVPGVTWISVQKGAGAMEAQSPPLDQPLVDLGARIRDFADTAAVLAQLDLLITVDTAVAHLCGALGKPCWVVLPCVGADWRWLAEREDSPWYPGVMRLFRQRAPGDWTPLVEEMRNALPEFSRTAARPPCGREITVR
ncbi:MAG: glycosyltransferase family protein [Magnetococcales bacterium]|nr:glycosyltransferase family protein [Magnetococcales bacterium]